MKLGMNRWHRLNQSPPGRRFRDRYHRHRDDSPTRRRLSIAAAIGLIAIGLVLMPFPGPGSLIVLIGLALLAGISLRVAHLLDRAELRLQALARRARSRWIRAPALWRVLLAVAVVACVAAMAYAGSILLFGS